MQPYRLCPWKLAALAYTLGAWGAGWSGYLVVRGVWS